MTPTVSVCVATYRRPDRLAACLAALAAQDLDPHDVEIVVADDASPAEDRVGEVVADARARSPFPIRLVTLARNSGAGVARNAAWTEAQGRWIAFTDDDCRPRPTWLRSLLAAAGSGDPEVAIVQGRTVPDPTCAHLVGRPFVRTLSVDDERGFYQTCNIAYRRTVLEDVGGFDARFARCGEDTDLAWRAKTAGARSTFAADAVVEHDVVEQGRRADLRSRARWADIPELVRRHPHLRALTWRNPVYRRSHVVPLIAGTTLPLLASRRGRRVFGLATTIAVASEVVRAGDPSAAVDALALRVADAYETVVIVRAGLRSRTVLV